MYAADGTPIQGHAAVPTVVHAEGVQGLPNQKGTCRDCRQSYNIRPNESNCDAGYFRCVRCKERNQNTFFEWAVVKDTCQIQ